MPSIDSVLKMPMLSMRPRATGARMSAPAPKPATLRPVMSPRLSGNHLMPVATGHT